MRQLNAFVTPEYPVIYDVIRSRDDASIPSDEVGVAVALLVRGIPSFLATHVLPTEELKSLLTSLDAGDVRVAVVGMPVQMKSDGGAQHHPAAFVSLVCADGRRVTMARIVGSAKDEGSSVNLARHVSRQIARGVQISELAAR